MRGIERPGFANKPGIWRFVYGHEQDTRRSLPGILWMGVPIAPTKLETLPQGEGNRETPACVGEGLYFFPIETQEKNTALHLRRVPTLRR